VARSADVAQAYEPLGHAHEAFVKLVEQRARKVGSVVVVDLSDELIEVAGKFVTYALFPESSYSVLLSRSKTRCKISVGYNPWSPVPRQHNVAAICERHGGGGHPVVGAITLAVEKLEEAKALTLAIAEELAA
jgi:c-di-AMP phosphodiesterase-like protein